MCNMFFIYRLVRFLPASKNIQIIVATVIDQIRNGGAFFGVLFVSAATLIGSTATIPCILELLLRLFDSWNGTIPRSSGYSLPTIQSIEHHVGNRALRRLDKNDYPICRICGTYEQLQYWPNAFDDFFVSEAERSLFSNSHASSLQSSMVTLYNIMIVNQWFVFVNAFRDVTQSR
jgi:hypothetical protein